MPKDKQTQAAESMAQQEREWAQAIAAAGVATEEQMREFEMPRPKSMEQLSEYIEGLVERPHDYGTCCYAMTFAALAAFNYVAGRLGVTGFQASCADMDFLSRSRGMKHGFRILDYENLLYPQYLNEARFPSYQHLIEENKERLAEAARKLLSENKGRDVHPGVQEHWEWMASLSPEKEEA